jgi:glycosyltransferase involved in cell wall biosynthesis
VPRPYDAPIALVSVLIPSYNHSQFIESCLDSVAGESWPRIELLVLDDASTDDSYDRAVSWAEVHSDRFERIVIERNPYNSGVCFSLNTLLDMAQGTFVTLLASDDMLTAGGIGARVAHFSRARGCDAVIGDCTLIDAQGVQKAGSVFVDHHGANKAALSKPRSLRRELILRWSVPGPVLLLRRDSLEKLGRPYFRPGLTAEDRDFYLRLLALATLHFVDVPVAKYRVHDANTWRTRHATVRRDVEWAEWESAPRFGPLLRLLVCFVALGRALHRAAAGGSRTAKVAQRLYVPVVRVVHRFHDLWVKVDRSALTT